MDSCILKYDGFLSRQISLAKRGGPPLFVFDPPFIPEALPSVPTSIFSTLSASSNRPHPPNVNDYLKTRVYILDPLRSYELTLSCPHQCGGVLRFRNWAKVARFAVNILFVIYILLC